MLTLDAARRVLDDAIGSPAGLAALARIVDTGELPPDLAHAALACFALHRGRVPSALRELDASGVRAAVVQGVAAAALAGDGSHAAALARSLMIDAPASLPATDLGGPRAAIEQRALAWLDAHLDEFRLSNGELPGIKRLGELGLVMWLLDRRREHARSRRLFELAWAELQEGELLVPLVERTPALSLLVMLYAFFHRLGARAPRVEDVLRRHLGAVPRMVALMAGNAAAQVGLVPPWNPAEALSWTAFGSRLAPWEMTSAQLYETTHVVFSLTDFASVPLTVGGEYVRMWLPVWLDTCVRIRHHDLVCELIAMWHCAFATCAPRRAWASIAAVQRADGAVPFRGDGASPEDYHSTLMAIAASLACSHE